MRFLPFWSPLQSFFGDVPRLSLANGLFVTGPSHLSQDTYIWYGMYMMSQVSIYMVSSSLISATTPHTAIYVMTDYAAWPDIRRWIVRTV